MPPMVKVSPQNGHIHTADATTQQLAQLPQGEVEAYKPFEFHGVNIFNRNANGQALGDCPFCGRPGKFHIDLKTTEWDCKLCNKGGNAVTFLRQFWELCQEKEIDYTELAANRKLLNADTLQKWQVTRSVLTEEWLVPGYTIKGELAQLYRYAFDRKRKKFTLYPTPLPVVNSKEEHRGHQLHGVNLFNKKAPIVFLGEGCWDGMMLWELLKPGKLKASVLAVPGANVFLPHWVELFADKEVVLLYDNDHPRPHPQTGKMVKGASLYGMEKVVTALTGAKFPPQSIRYLRWGDNGFDPSLPNGYDLRDVLSKFPDAAGRVTAFANLGMRITEVPQEWTAKEKSKAEKEAATVKSVKCETWKELTNAWRKAMKWTEGLERGLAFCLACIASTRAVGDQLWGKLLSPPGSGKSVICEALAVSKHVVEESSITGFYSGADLGKEREDEDPSLVAKLKDRTLVIKDGDTLIKAPNLEQILAEMRDIYDRRGRATYRNGISRGYSNHNITILLCGTKALRKIDRSDLGVRFLDCVIMETIDAELEEEILLRVAARTQRNIGLETIKDSVAQDDPDMMLVKQLTGGYVDYLRDNSQRLLDVVSKAGDYNRQCIPLAKFVAYLRARPSEDPDNDESAERELASRLTSQLVRLAGCVAAVLNKRSVDAEVMRIVKQTALDTARGVTLKIVETLWKFGSEGMETKTLMRKCELTDKKGTELLRFLRLIKVLEYFKHQMGDVVAGKPRWRIARDFKVLFQEVMNLEEIEEF